MEKPSEKDVKQEEMNENLKEKKSHKIEKLENEVEKYKADAEHWKNEYYRAYADMKNLRDSLQKDHSNAMKYRAEGFLEALFPVLDSFHMALNNEVKDEAVKNYLVGFQFIYRNLVSALESEGVSELCPNVGDKFDSLTMNAVDTVETKDMEENKVVKIYSKGYKLHDRLVRPVMVQVSKKPTEENKDNADA